MHTQSNGDKRHVLSSGEFSEVHPSHISDKDSKYGATQTMQDSQTAYFDIDRTQWQITEKNT